MTTERFDSSSDESVEPDADGIPELLERIRAEIRDEGPITFARFMERALYEPGLGYYAAGETVIGTAGDFVTASDVGRHFGSCLARQISEIDRVAGPWDPFLIAEFGAGRGLLARDILDALSERSPELRSRSSYRMIDRARPMRLAAQHQVPEAEVRTPEDPGVEGSGCVIAVELFDALPVQRVRRRDGKLFEIQVGLGDDDRLVELERLAGEPLVAAADRYGAARCDGAEAEIVPSLEAELARMAATLERGVIIIVDYGDDADRLYSRECGTLLAYYRQSTNEDYLRRVGRQDLTAHVNFTALEDAARALGLEVLGSTSQDRFLISNGILETFDEPDEQRWRRPDRVKARLQAMQLIHPSAMGRSFRFLLLSKGIDPPPRLAGLDDPFSREA